MNALLKDNAKANTQVRDKNIDFLLSEGFIESGYPSRSGEMYIMTTQTKANIIFGKKCNIGGKGTTKYFSLMKSFSSYDEAKKYIDSIKNKIEVI